MSARPAGLVEVLVLGLPLDLWAHAQEHLDDLLREFALLVAGDATTEGPHIPRKLLQLVEELQADYAGIATDQEDQITGAWAAGERTIDLTYHLPSQVADACRRLDAALDEADAYCQAGEYLLTLATPAEPLAFRHWFLTQLADQIEGKAPEAWDEWRSAHAVMGRKLPAPGDDVPTTPLRSREAR